MGGRGWEVGDEEVFFEVFGLGDDVALGVEEDGVAVEDEFVVAADLVDVGDGEVPAASLVGEEFVAVVVFSEYEGGGGDVEEELGAGVGECGDGVEVVEGAFEEFLIVPEVFADGDADGDVVDGGEFDIGAGLEVAGFVEDVVGGEEGFAAASEDLAVGDDGDGVVEEATCGAGIFFGEADDGDDVFGGIGDAGDGFFGEGEGGGFEEEVFGGIAEDGEFGEEDDVGVLGFGGGDHVEVFFEVAGDVADGGVDLGEGDAHEGLRRGQVRYCSGRWGGRNGRGGIRRRWLGWGWGNRSRRVVYGRR